MNIDNLQPLLNWISVHPHLAYFIIFLLSLSESLVVIGLIVPGIAIMTIIGTFVGTGYLEFWPTFIVSILGAVVGDGISYWIGQSFQNQLRNWWIFKKYPEIITRCERFFNKHGGKSVVFGRFVGPVRPMIPAVAGMMKMPPQHFYMVNIISAFLWAPVYLFPGIIFGNTLTELPPEVSTKIITFLILVLFSTWIIIKIIKAFLYRFKRKTRKYGTKILTYAEKNSLSFLQRHIRHPLSHKKHQADTFLLLLFLLLVTSLHILFTKLRFVTTSLNAFFKNLSLMTYSENINHFLLTIDNSSSVTSIFLIFTGLILLFIAAAKSSTVARSLFIKHPSKNQTRALYRTALISIGLIVTYFCFGYLSSIIVQYPKPFNLNNNSFSWFYSFPDINMGLLTLLAGYLSIIKYCHKPRQYVNSSYTLYSISILLLFFALKLYLGHSWFSDLIGAVLLSSCVLLAFCIIYWQNPLVNINYNNFNKYITIICLSILTVVNFRFYQQNRTNAFANYDIKQAAIIQEPINIDQKDWLDNNLFSETADPIINVQWLGHKKQIIESLTRRGWYEQPKFNFDTLLTLFINKPTANQLPLIPKYYLDNNSIITLSKLAPNNKILNLRLWQSEYQVDEKTLWVGTVQYFKPKKSFDLVTYLEHWPRAEFGDSLEKFANEVNNLLINNERLSSKIIQSDHSGVDDNLKIIYIN